MVQSLPTAIDYVLQFVPPGWSSSTATVEAVARFHAGCCLLKVQNIPYKTRQIVDKTHIGYGNRLSLCRVHPAWIDSCSVGLLAANKYVNWLAEMPANEVAKSVVDAGFAKANVLAAVPPGGSRGWYLVLPAKSVDQPPASTAAAWNIAAPPLRLTFRIVGGC